MEADLSLCKARDLLRLAEMAAARHGGVTLTDITAEFGTDHRSAQRMVRAFETVFDNVEITIDDERRRHWRLRGTRLVAMQGMRSDELVALEIGIRRAQREGAENEVHALQSLRDRLLAAMPAAQARRIEADAEPILEAYAFASFPAPAPDGIVPQVLEAVAEALKGPYQLEIDCAGEDGHARAPRLVEPHGLIMDGGHCLVARDPDRGATMCDFPLEQIRAARLVMRTFQRDPAFSIEAHAARAFGGRHEENENGAIVWRFHPSVADRARTFMFHPAQEVTVEDDGALTVRFRSCGWQEMAWLLYQWDDKVFVLAPAKLADRVAGLQRRAIAPPCREGVCADGPCSGAVQPPFRPCTARHGAGQVGFVCPADRTERRAADHR